jgi:hypothetical protein
MNGEEFEDIDVGARGPATSKTDEAGVLRVIQKPSPACEAGVSEEFH